jgi:hypothetical protein
VPRDPARPRVEIRAGGACPDPGLARDVVVVRTAPTPAAGCVAPALLEALALAPEAALDRSPFYAHADEIEDLQIAPAAPGEPRVDIARRGGGWHERAPTERDLAGGEVDSAAALVAALAGARGASARLGDPGEHFAARTRVTIVRTGGEASEVVEVGAPDASGNVPARRLDDGAVLPLPRAAARRFEAHPIALSDTIVWRAPVDPGAAVGIDNSCGRTPERLDLERGAWKARGFEVDDLAAADLAASIARARADAWVAEADDGSFGFGKDGSCTVTLTLDGADDGGPARRVGLVFGAEGEGGYYARSLDGPGVFLAPAALREIAGRPAVDRSRLRLDPASLARVVFSRGDARRVLSRAPGAERLTREGEDPEGTTAEDRLASAIAALRAESALHVGPAERGEGLDKPTLEIDARALAGGAAETRIEIGAPTHDGAHEAYFARVAGVDATFAVPRSAVDAILDAW